MSTSFAFEALRSRRGQAEAILVAYDLMEDDGHDVRPEPLEARRKRLAKLLRAKTKALRLMVEYMSWDDGPAGGDEKPRRLNQRG